MRARIWSSFTQSALIGRAVPVPETLAALFARPTQCTEIEAQLPALRGVLQEGS